MHAHKSFKIIKYAAKAFLPALLCLTISTTTIARTSEKIRDLLCNKTKLDNCQIIDSKPITDGFGGAKIFKVTTQDKHEYIARFFGSKVSETNKAHEIQILHSVSDRGIAPKLYVADSNDGMLMDYIPHQGFTRDEYKDVKFHRQAAKLISSLHQGPDFPSRVEKFEKLNQITSTILKLNHNQVPYKVEQAMQMLASIEANYMPHLTTAPSHNDLHFRNLLFDGDRLWLIDWESAGQTDPFFDVASYLNFFVFDAKLEQAFLHEYNPNFSLTERHRLSIMKAFVKAYYAFTTYEITLKIANKQAHAESLQQELNQQLENEDKDFFSLVSTKPITLNSPEEIIEFSAVLLNDFFSEIESREFELAMEYLDHHN